MIRIFCGTEPKTEIACKVLEFSIRRRTKEEVKFVPMIGPGWEYSTEGVQVGTGFSLRRWMIPSACAWKGKAIYMDADQLVLADVKELWDKDKEDGGKGTIYCSFQPDKFSKKPWPQTSVMLIDCEKARGHNEFYIALALGWLKKHNTKKEYADFMHAAWLKDGVVRIGNEWNHLNEYRSTLGKDCTRLVHFTKEDSQPWYMPTHPLAHLWENELKAAITASVISKGEFEAALGKWNVKEDWRPTNGLHPHYRKYLSLFKG